MNINALKAAQQGAQKSMGTAQSVGQQNQAVNEANQQTSKTANKNEGVRGERKIEEQKAAFQAAKRDAAIELKYAQQQSVVSGVQGMANGALNLVNRFLS